MPFQVDVPAVISLGLFTATNDSQFESACYGFLATTGLLSLIKVLYVVVGDTKFGRDGIMLAVNGKFYSFPTFTTLMLSHDTSNYAKFFDYSSRLVDPGKGGPGIVFNEVRSIMSNCFYFILTVSKNVQIIYGKLLNYEPYDGKYLIF